MLSEAKHLGAALTNQVGKIAGNHHVMLSEAKHLVAALVDLLARDASLHSA